MSPTIQLMTCSYLRVGIKNTRRWNNYPILEKEYQVVKINWIRLTGVQTKFKSSLSLSFFHISQNNYSPVYRFDLDVDPCHAPHIHPSIRPAPLPQPQLCHFQAIPFAPFRTFVSYFFLLNCFPSHPTELEPHCVVSLFISAAVPETLKCTFDGATFIIVLVAWG